MSKEEIKGDIWWRAMAQLSDGADSEKEMCEIVNNWKETYGGVEIQFSQLNNGKYQVWGNIIENEK